MTKNIVWTHAASSDLKLTYLFYLPLNPQAAQKILSMIRMESKQLISFPDLGFVEPILSGKTPIARSLIIKKIFKIIYYQQKNKIYITNIWDCRQNPENLKHPAQ